jgi:RNA polymerase sigma factor (sigma-70 family)
MPHTDGPSAGDNGAEPGNLAELFVLLEGPLLSHAMKWIFDRPTAEDIVQEAFLRLHREEAAVLQPRAWLYRTVHNLACSHLRAAALRSGRVVVDAGVTEAVDPEPLPDEAALRMEERALAGLCLDRLPERHREVVSLRYREQLSYREIAARTGLTVNHVGVLLSQALKLLADAMRRHGWS